MGRIENKYYKPEIEEFHVGFDYEQLQDEMLFGQVVTGMDYCQYTFEIEDDLSNIKSNIKKGRIRVKYLDKDDIESLEFISTDGLKATKHIPALFKKDNYELKLHYDGVVSIHHKKEYGESSYLMQPLFRGTIKNKSELKIILKQLNVI